MKPVEEKPLYVYIGTYTTENAKKNRNAHGVGIYVYSIDRLSGAWTPVQEVPALNPAVLQFGKDKKYIYCCNSNSSSVSAYARDEQSGMLTYCNSVRTGENNVLIISVDPAGEWMVAGDHKRGFISVIRINGDGSLGEITDSFYLPGEKGPLNEKIQPWSRPHHVPFSPDGNYVLIADKGLDAVHSYAIDTERGKLSPVQVLKCHGASCPRHIWWHPNGRWLYVNTEYTSTIIACRYDKQTGMIEPFQVVSALPDDYFDVKNMTSELAVHPNGRFLYISNRRHNSLGAFSIDQESGRLAPIGWVNCGGIKPRFFAIEPGGRFLFCGNQSSDTITVFAIDQESGALADTGKVIHTPTPVWMLFTDAVPSVEALKEGGAR